MEPSSKFGNITSHYAHLSKVYSKVGSFIKQGEALGAVGSTGASTGSHLYLELRENGISLNPPKSTLWFK